jgi:hypothetical protein
LGQSKFFLLPTGGNINVAGVCRNLQRAAERMEAERAGRSLRTQIQFAVDPPALIA